MKDTFSMKGRYVIEARDAATNRLIKAWRLENALTSINQSTRCQMLLGTYTGALDALQIKYFAFGTDSTPATASDTELGAEVYRKQITQISQADPATIQSVVSLGSQECNYNIREIGVFAGPNASSTPNSGTLLSRINVNIDKNTNIVLNIVRSDICNI